MYTMVIMWKSFVMLWGWYVVCVIFVNRHDYIYQYGYKNYQFLHKYYAMKKFPIVPHFTNSPQSGNQLNSSIIIIKNYLRLKKYALKLIDKQGFSLMMDEIIMILIKKLNQTRFSKL